MHQSNSLSPNRPSVLGLHRLEQVLVMVGGGRPVALVTGVAHRYPRRFRVSMATAARLAQAGLPVRIQHRGAAEQDRGRSR